jgi:acetolactate synthase-1/2/3 large subunit
VWVVWNNYGYCSIRDLQLGLFKTGELATSFAKDRTAHLQNPDFAMLARSMGVAARASSAR